MELPRFEKISQQQREKKKAKCSSNIGINTSSTIEHEKGGDWLSGSHDRHPKHGKNSRHKPTAKRGLKLEKTCTLMKGHPRNQTGRGEQKNQEGGGKA